MLISKSVGVNGHDRDLKNSSFLRLPFVGLLILLMLSGASLTAGSARDVDLTELSIEDLMDIEVTSVSKKVEKLSEAAAAVYVISRDDLRRSGVVSIPDALRMVPGVQVASIDASKWAVASRGFNGRFANKLLVLVDGRSVYTPLYSGVYWERLNLTLDNIERIEVIRGPGASLWGANAVNGVINIITRKSDDTQGGYLQVGTGTEEKGGGDLRYGGTLGDKTAYRLYLKDFKRQPFTDSLGHESTDDWSNYSGGFRLDYTASENNSLTFLGDGNYGVTGQTYRMITSLDYPYWNEFDSLSRLGDFDLLGRWTGTLSNTSEISAQISYDWRRLDDPMALITENIWNVDISHRFRLDARQEVIWGLGYRWKSDQVDGTFAVDLNPAERTDRLYSAFVQNNITAIPDRLRFTIGSKFEHNDYTGAEIQPTVRLSWTPNSHQTVWAAVSRAVRTPSRADSDVFFIHDAYPPGALSPESPVTVIANLGSPEFESEELIAYECGVRYQPADRLLLDLAVFYNDYDHLRGYTNSAPYLELSAAVPYMVLPLEVFNAAEGEAYGGELAASLQATGWWRLYASYSNLQMSLRARDDLNTPAYFGSAAENPKNQAYLRSAMDLSRRLELDAVIRYMDDLPALKVNAYTTMDLRIGYSISDYLTLSLIGRNLFDDHHAEYIPDYIETRPTEVERSFYASAKLEF